VTVLATSSGLTGTELLTFIVAGLTATTLATGLLAGLARVALVPWLRTHLVEPVKETNRQVTVNGHESPEPTMLDKLDTVSRKVDQVERRQGELRVELGDELRAAGRMFDGHIERSAGEWSRLWDAIGQLQRADTPPHPPRGTDHDVDPHRP